MRVRAGWVREKREKKKSTGKQQRARRRFKLGVQGEPWFLRAHNTIFFSEAAAKLLFEKKSNNHTGSMEKEKKTTPLKRAAGSKGSLHSLLQSSPPPLNDEGLDDDDAPPMSFLTQSVEEVVFRQQQSPSAPHRLSQSYSQPRSSLAIRARLAASDSEKRGELEWLDLRTVEWRECACVVKDGFVTCYAPGGDGEDEDRPARNDDGTFQLEDLAPSRGERGNLSASLSLTNLAIVGTAPQRGPHAFRLVVESDDGREIERTFRAQDKDEMHDWLFAFQRSLAIVIDRLREQPRTAADAGDAAAARTTEAWRSLSLRKKSSSRRGAAVPCFFSPESGAPADDVVPPTPPGNVSLATSLDDEGLGLFRKSSARPRIRRSREKIAATPPPPLPLPTTPPPPPEDEAKNEPVGGGQVSREDDDDEGGPPKTPSEDAPPTPGKYVPPHRRRRMQHGDCGEVPPPADGFEEVGDDDQNPPPPPGVDEEQEWFRKEGSRLEWRSGSRCEQGNRRRNEDACVDFCDLLTTDQARFAYFGVYDGHSGTDAVLRCESELHARVADSLRPGTCDVSTALGSSFASIDAEYYADAANGDASLDSGATALACVLSVSGNVEPCLIVANCGDCVAVLSRKGRAILLSKSHTPTPHSAEAARVEAAGGWITTETDLCLGRLHNMDLDDPEISATAQDRVRLNEIHRVCGEVAVTRAIGDVDFKGWTGPSAHSKQSPFFQYPPGHPRRFTADLLIATPEITKHDVVGGDDCVILATDGLWDVVEPQEAVTVASRLLSQNRTPQAVADHLVGRAVRLGTGDNITVVVVQLRWI